jgi:hypothetical protein
VGEGTQTLLAILAGFLILPVIVIVTVLDLGIGVLLVVLLGGFATWRMARSRM